MLSLLNPLKPHYTAEGAGVSLGVTSTNYDEKAILMEGFSRPLWGLVPFWAGGGKEPWFEAVCRRGLAAGTDPENPEFWGAPGEYDQRFIEMGAIAFGMLLAGDVLWEPLDSEEKRRLAAYLYTINEHQIPCCNWLLFRVLVNLALKENGMPYDRERLFEALDLTESFYLGSGWYRDGDSNQKDYYVSVAIQFYSLIYAMFMEDEDKERCGRFRERALLFAKEFIYWFDGDGEALPFGRSLIYRFAQAAFLEACLLADVAPFPVPVMKGLIVRHIKYWMQQPVFDREGILTIGYAYPNLVMAEKYNGPGSVYWSMMAFTVLALPDKHPFWTAEAAEFPKVPDICSMPEADMLVRRYRHHVTAYVPGVYSPNGHGQIVAKYGKFAYDTKFGFSVAKSCYELYENCPDSMLAFFIDGYVYVRRICEERAVREDSVWSRWSPYPGIEVETTIIPTENGHKRIHKIESTVKCEAYDCGFSVGAKLSEAFASREEKGFCLAENKRMKCAVSSAEGEGVLITADPNTNVLYSKTRIPSIKYKIQKGVQTLCTEITAEVKEEALTRLVKDWKPYW